MLGIAAETKVAALIGQGRLITARSVIGTLAFGPLFQVFAFVLPLPRALA